jgi:hypothetical protein
MFMSELFLIAIVRGFHSTMAEYGREFFAKNIGATSAFNDSIDPLPYDNSTDSFAIESVIQPGADRVPGC